MALSDFLYVAQWWFVLFILGLAFNSFTGRVFPNFIDKGYVFSKILGMGIVSYIVLLLGILHILPFTQWEISVVLILCLLVTNSRLVFRPFKLVVSTSLLNLLRANWRMYLLEEIIFFWCLYFWSYIRAFSPDIHGLEKYMDFGFVNSILRSTYFPPQDIWFPPFSINYYYFGHLVTAVLTKLSNIPSFITFNLMIATLFALSFTAVFSIGLNLVSFLGQQRILGTIRAVIGGLLMALLVTIAGNLHILYAFFKPYPNDSPVPLWQLAYNPGGFPNAYWYPNATRFIFNTIHEFPIYSWVVSDLHGHVLDIPFVLTTIALLLSIMIKFGKPVKSPTRSIKHKSQFIHYLHLKYIAIINNSRLDIKNLLLLGFLLAIMYMTNAWDGGIYFLLTLLVLIYTQFNKNLSIFFSNTLYPFLIIIAAFILFALPFSLFFNPGSLAHGIGFLCAPDFLTKIGRIGPFLFEPNHCQKSPWWQLLILYGFFAFFAASFLVLFQRLRKVSAVDWFIFLLIVLSAILIIIPEFVYLKDIYPDHYRANTMFKLVFQAYIMLSIASGYTIIRLAGLFRDLIRQQRWLSSIGLGSWLIMAIGLCSLVSLYPYLAIMSYYGNLQTYRGLDGTTYLQTLYPTDYTAINWINKNIKGQPVMLEAQGDSYTDYERVSANTGLPTILGWTVHEWLWRGSYSVPAPRIAEVQTIYTSSDLGITKQLLRKYKVQYVFIGYLERQKYPNLDINKFNILGKIVYQNGATKIYKLYAY